MSIEHICLVFANICLLAFTDPGRNQQGRTACNETQGVDPQFFYIKCTLVLVIWFCPSGMASFDWYSNTAVALTDSERRC